MSQSDKIYQNQYGYLSDDAREFIITNPETPRPWFNYCWNDRYCALVSHTGGGFSYLDSPRDNRISRIRYNSLPWDRPGRYIFVKDAESKQYWSLSWAPTNHLSYDFYQCHVGQGYTTMITEFQDIRAELTYFVPRNDQCELWKVKLVNKSQRTRKLEIYAFQELVMGNALNDLINQPNDKHFTEIVYNKKWQCLEATRRYWVLNKKSATVEQPNFAWPYKVYFTTNLQVTGYDGSLDQFIGKWRSEANPIAIEQSKMNNSEITSGDPVVALQSKIELQADSDVDFTIYSGIAEKTDKDPYQKLKVKNYKDPAFVEAKLQEVKQYWNNYLAHIQVNSPDERFNAMQNVWNAYQSAVTFDMARNAGFYHGGLLFGTGMRDQFQDILGMVMVHPERVRARILNALQYQFKDGSCLHNFFKLTGDGERTYHSDTPLWIPFGIVEYLNETADLSILDEMVGFYDEGKASVYEHLKRAIDFAISDTTARGFPKIRKGDWNDTLDQIGTKGKGESIWGAFFLGYIIQKTIELLNVTGDIESKKRWLDFYEKLAENLNESAWDGNWYVRAFNDNGNAIGTNEHHQGKVFLNAQSWSVISGIAPKERADIALQSCVQYLKNKTGMQICWPPYKEVEESTGLVSRCVPGKKENAAVFNHASAWFVLAAVMNGNKSVAIENYMNMLPFYSTEKVGIDCYETEPYVFSEYLTSKEHETEGQASHSWLTGSSVWMQRIGLDYILGLHTGIKGLQLQPNFPSAWKKVKVERKFREKNLIVHYINDQEQYTEIKEIRINGKHVSQDIIEVEKYTEDTLNIDVILA